MNTAIIVFLTPSLPFFMLFQPDFAPFHGKGELDTMFMSDAINAQ